MYFRIDTGLMMRFIFMLYKSIEVSENYNAVYTLYSSSNGIYTNSGNKTK